ncbi:MAG TPA: hypothetical protein V6C81_27030 [Planktothrix sp.]|jgi:FtsH-binding integral membrane protein
MWPENLNFGRKGWLVYFASVAVVFLIGSLFSFAHSAEKEWGFGLFILFIVSAVVAIVLSFAGDKSKNEDGTN